MTKLNTGLIDLHVHTTASDGTMTPEEVVFHAAAQGLKAIAITDHDTVAGIPEALEAGIRAGIEVVPGVELSVKYPGEMHILGYYIDCQNPILDRGLDLLSLYRSERNPQMVRKLQNLGCQISMEEVTNEASGGIIGRPHYAAIMVRKGFVRDFADAFELYLGVGKPAYVEKDKLTPGQGIEMIVAAGGIPVLAHPKYLQLSDNIGLDNLVQELKQHGLGGIEVFYSENTPDETERYFSLAIDHGLAVTGGTDFHGSIKPELKIGKGKGNLEVRYNFLERLKEIKKRVKN